jgi:hypothetical protein
MKLKIRFVLISMLMLIYLISGLFPNQFTVKADSLTQLSEADLTDENTFSDLPYRTDSSLTLSTAPKIGEMAELTFTIKVNICDSM